MKPIVFISGASRGIGRSTAMRFAKAGYPVAVNCIYQEKALQSLQQEIQDIGGVCHTYLTNIKDYSEVEKMFSQIKIDMGDIGILVNNAGISSTGVFQEMHFEDYSNLIQVNLLSVMHCCHLALPAMIHNKSGKIINISSVWGLVGASCEAVYSASKGGVNSFTKALGKELAPSGIQVNAIACGFIDTDMNKNITSEERDILIEQIPAGRFGQAEEVADLIFSIAEGHPYLNGQVITLDGGWI